MAVPGLGAVIDGDGHLVTDMKGVANFMPEGWMGCKLRTPSRR